MCIRIVSRQHAAWHSPEQMINFVSRVQERKVQKNAPNEKRRLDHVLCHVAIVGGQNNVAGDYEEEVCRYNEAQAGFFLYLLWTEFQLKVDNK